MGSNKKDVDPCGELKTRIPELPNVMISQGWFVGAKLMDHWLQMGANNVPEKGIHSTRDVKMSWVLSFGLAQRVYQPAKKQKVWVNEAAQDVIVDKLIHKKGRLPQTVGESLEIGNVGEGESLHPGNILQFHNDWQIQLKKVEQAPWKDPLNIELNDLYGALGDFTFYYLVKGWVERLPDQSGKPRYKVSINKVGVYVGDKYDFNDEKNPLYPSQPLGIWGCKKPYIGFVPGFDRYYVKNENFREWRDKYGQGRGGDFMVFSDIKVFNTNDSFEF